MNRLSCPADVRIWPMVVGEPVRRGVARHVEACSSCQRRVRDWRRRLELCRKSTAAARRYDAVVREPVVGPTRIGDYEILGELGQGGQAIVYRAWHPRLAMEVALKRLWPAAAESSTALVKESLFLSAASHPALPVPLDIEVIDGATYLSMELIHGEVLSQCQRTLTAAEVCRIARQLTAAIAELHDSQILHLDLSPGNVLLDENDRCRLIDFGLARKFPAPSTPSEIVVAGGTPGFVAPEALRWPQVVDCRTDVYGLGALVYYLLTGRSPQLDGDCGSRWQADPIGSRLLAISVRALSIDPAKRFSDATEMLAALDEVDKPSRSRRGLMVAAVAACLLLGANRELIGHVEADVSIGDAPHVRSLAAAPDIKLGDHVAFSFDWQGNSAGLAIRTPSGRVVPMKPFVRTNGKAFCYPPTGTAILRQQAGTYVAYFAPLMESRDDASNSLLEAIDRLPPPPNLGRGEHLLSIAGVDRPIPIDRPFDERSAWLNAVVSCRASFPGLSAIAFHVD